ncbi:intracellular protein transport protein USO1-like [Gambusia affinis]|uniref:intracellular protein transport protein USO1-like n=1 Tax=Gambusia affinis TaxID=33528 RepID=UPI001CDD3E7B|nr:intracellular protein transport protein USO1-like [Gambusia affinis]
MDPPKTKPEDSAPEVGPQQTAKTKVTEDTSINTPNSDEQSSGPIPDVSQTVPGSENNLGTQSYDSQWMKQQNDRVENLMKKVKFQKSKDKEIMVEVEHHGVHKSEKILIRKKTKKLTEEIVTLKSKNSQLNKQISELRLSWEMEKRAKEEAEKKVKILLDENIHHSEETAELQKEITRLEETISILEIKSEQETEHWKTTTKYTETGDTVDGTGINFGGFRKTDSSIEIMIAEHESQIIEWEKKVNEKQTKLTEALNKIVSLSRDIDIKTKQIEFLHTAIQKAEEMYKSQYEALLTEKNQEYQNYKSLRLEHQRMRLVIEKYNSLLEFEESRIKKSVPDKQSSDSEGVGNTETTKFTNEYEEKNSYCKMKINAEGVAAEHLNKNIKTKTTVTSTTNSEQDVNPQETGSPQSGSGMEDMKGKLDQGGKNKTGTSSQTPIQENKPVETGSPQSGSGKKDTKGKLDQGGKNKTGTSGQTPI